MTCRKCVYVIRIEKKIKAGLLVKHICSLCNKRVEDADKQQSWCPELEEKKCKE